MPKKQKPDARMEDVKEKFLERAEELWDAHESEFTGVLDDSENHMLNLNFTATLDFSESTAKLQTTIRFSQVVKDRKEDDFDDPNQPQLPGAEFEANAAKKKKDKGRGKRRSASDELSGKDAAAGERVEA